MTEQSKIPRDRSWDSTLALKREGYQFIGNRCRRLATDVFATRLLLQTTLCLRGRDAAQLFYDDVLFQRGGAAPDRIKKTLFGEGGVQGLDGETHRLRKQIFLPLLQDQVIQELKTQTRRQWLLAIQRWVGAGPIVLLDAVAEIHCRAVCEWLGLNLSETQVAEVTRSLMNLIEGPAQIGPGHWRSRRSRRKLEKMCAGCIAAARNNPQQHDQRTMTALIASHRDATGNQLSESVAAVELLNILRPTVAVAWYVVFLALALHDYPRQVSRLNDADIGERRLRRNCFIEEVRRFYPFFPAVVARVKQPFRWRGYFFPRGRRVLLDLYGTNHDARIWRDPEQFLPERFLSPLKDDYCLIPQGGGSYSQQHRCAGEKITVALMDLALQVLLEDIAYSVPPQNLRIPQNRMPTGPQSQFVITSVTERRKQFARRLNINAGSSAKIVDGMFCSRKGAKHAKEMKKIN